MSEETPYRESSPDPVCARCKHRREARLMDSSEPWRDWRCAANERVIWPEEYNPITGITKPAQMGLEQCVRVNGDGKCSKFEPASPASAQPPCQVAEPEVAPEVVAEPQVLPTPRQKPWWQRLFGH